MGLRDVLYCRLDQKNRSRRFAFERNAHSDHRPRRSSRNSVTSAWTISSTERPVSSLAWARAESLAFRSRLEIGMASATQISLEYDTYAGRPDNPGSCKGNESRLPGV